MNNTAKEKNRRKPKVVKMTDKFAGLKTHYLWEEILTKDSLANIIDKFAQVVEEKDEETCNP